MWFEVAGTNSGTLRKFYGDLFEAGRLPQLPAGPHQRSHVGERFEEEPGRTLRDRLQQYGKAAVRLLDSRRYGTEAGGTRFFVACSNA